MSTNLTPAQALALRVARLALAAAEDDSDRPPDGRQPSAYWVARLKAALHDIADAFPGDES